ncbi:class I SAM-dependent methyltransferase [Alphaproteobacteria bacterium]|nr:class I SAM-dependent methyltransferase [Alphaproteobacteria bacterium]
MIAEIKACRICSSPKLEVVIDLKEQALSGFFPDKNTTEVEVFPLTLVKCASCGLVQLQHSVAQEILYHENYGYRSGINATMTNHLASIVKSIESKVLLHDGDVVVDIASNDGTLLNAYRNKHLKRIGVDPASKQFGDYYEPDILKVPKFFSREAIEPFLEAKKAKVVTSIAVFYDLESPSEFVNSVKDILDSDGCWVLEQSDLGSMIKSNSFDTICHEHLEYYSVSVLKKLLEHHDLRIFDAELNASNGGSHRLYVCHQNSTFQTNHNSINDILQNENKIGLLDNQTYLEFMSRCKIEMKKLFGFVQDKIKSGKKFHIYGASTKGNVLLQFCSLGVKQIEIAAERNPRKWGCYTPGTKIPIQSETASRDLCPDYYIVLPWHFRDEFIIREAEFLKKGASFIFPLPYFEVYSDDEA